MISYQAKRWQSSFSLDIVARYLTAGFSFFNILLLVKMQSLDDFSSFQVAFSFSSLLIWISDFGLGVSLIQAMARNTNDTAKSIWTLRVAIFILMTIIGCTLAASFFTINFLFFLLAANFDAFTDSNLNFRVVSAKRILYYFFQPIKKIVQFVLLTMLQVSSLTIDSKLICVVFLLPSIIILVLDTHIYGGFTKNLDFSHIKHSIGKWIQSGGLALVNLDNLILSHFGMSAVIAVLSITKKIYSVIAIIGTAAIPKVLYSVTKDEGISKPIQNMILKVTFLCASFATLTAIVHPILFKFLLNNLPLEFENHLMIAVYLLTLPLTIINLALNSSLLGLSRNLSAGLVTYFCGFLYISVLYVSLKFIDGSFAIVIAMILYTLSWTSLQILLLWKNIIR